eukprot:12455600-Heterocapsa_arctica.AAC.1
MLASAPFASPALTMNHSMVFPVMQVGAPGSTYAAAQLAPSMVNSPGGRFQSPPTTQGTLPIADKCLPTLPLKTAVPSAWFFWPISCP